MQRRVKCEKENTRGPGGSVQRTGKPGDRGLERSQKRLSVTSYIGMTPMKGVNKIEERFRLRVGGAFSMFYHYSYLSSC